MRFLSVLLLVFGGCKTDDAAAPPKIGTTVLAAATTDEPYEAALSGSGVDIIWSVEDELPPGLALNPLGIVSGVPSHAGDYSFSLRITDEEGQVDSADFAIEIEWSDDALPCGEWWKHQFAEAALVDGDFDLTVTDGWAHISLPLPDEDVTRIEIVGDGGGNLYLAKPGAPRGSTDLSYYDEYEDFSFGSVIVDDSTWRNLRTYRSFEQPIDLLIAGDDNGGWSLYNNCTKGPVFQELTFVPAIVGEPLFINYNVWGDNSNLTIWTDDPLPDWVDWDEEWGWVTGTPDEEGVWEIEVHVEDE
ncbi:MAG: hypothetical protein HN348_07340, partial [Proteobacteria bacterium]|nr:hypothetical protein [Pseudomonadota bacterium]